MATTSSGFTPLCGSLPKKFGHLLDDLRHAGHAADQNHLVDVALRQPGILQRRLAGLDRALDQVATRLSSLARVSFITMCSG
jgi:hypothetical protein